MLHNALTSDAMVREDWLASGISESLADANIHAIIADAKNNLNAWIADFVGSFKPGRLRETLEDSYFLREEGILQTKSGSVEGLGVIIRPRTLREFRFLLRKIKQIRYRILKFDPNVRFLLLVTPNLQHTIAIELIGNGEVAE